MLLAPETIRRTKIINGGFANVIIEMVRDQQIAGDVDLDGGEVETGLAEVTAVMVEMILTTTIVVMVLVAHIAGAGAAEADGVTRRRTSAEVSSNR